MSVDEEKKPVEPAHLFAEEGSPYNLRCVGCGVWSLDEAAKQPCPRPVKTRSW